jgi:pimeloyl-ACP methyl ester carboxylesterase
LTFRKNTTDSYLLGNNTFSVGEEFFGVKFQFSIILQKGNVSYSLSKVNSDWGGGFFNGGYQVAFANKIGFANRYTNELNLGFLPFEFLNYLEITATNANEFVINSININKTSVKPPLFNVSTIFSPKILNDSNDRFLPPMIITKSNPVALAQWHHPNATSGNAYHAATFATFFNQNIAMCWITGNSVNNPTGANLFGAGVSSSNWGAIIGMKYRKRLMDVASELLAVKNLISWGGSMGGLNALAYSTLYPDNIACIISISGALDLATNFNNATYTNIIRKAYSSAYVCIANNTNIAVTDTLTWTKIANEKSAPNNSYYKNNQFLDTYSTTKAYVVGDVTFVNYSGDAVGLNSFSPYFNGNKLSQIPTLLIHGDNDTLIPLSQSSGYLNYINTKGGVKTELVTIVGGTHVSDSCFQVDTIMDFINRHI